MSLIDPELQNAEAGSKAARRALTDTLVALQARLNPKALALEAAEELKEAGQEIMRKGVDAVIERPLKAAGVATALGVFLFRKPLRRLVASEKHETAGDAKSLTKRPIPTRRRGKGK